MKDNMGVFGDLSSLYDQAIIFIFCVLRSNKFRLKDVPFDVRKSSETVYVGAIDTSMAISCERYIEDLELMADDITKMPEDWNVISASESMKECLLKRIEHYLDVMGRYDGVDEFEMAKKRIKRKLQI